MQKKLPIKLKNLKVALVTDWLTSSGGAEVVVKSIAELFPTAPIFTSVVNYDGIDEFFRQRTIKTTWLQKIPFLNKHHQWLLPLLPSAMESLNLKKYDLIISFSSAIGKGVQTGKNQAHICYIHCPMRWVWEPELDSRFQNFPIILKPAISLLFKYLKAWDIKTSKFPTQFIANSKTTAKRVEKYYKLPSKVLFPPVILKNFSIAKKTSQNYFFALGRLVPYKNFPLLVKTFAKLPKQELIIAGDGPDFAKLEKIISQEKCTNIKLLGRVSDEKRQELLSQARALLHPQIEDAGIVQLEAMASGVPVIAFAEGGSCEVIKECINGIFFHEQTTKSLSEAIKKFEKQKFSPEKIRKSVEEFSQENFQTKFLQLITKSL